MKSDTKSDKKSDEKNGQEFPTIFEHGTGSVIYNKWLVKTLGNAIMFANCNDKIPLKPAYLFIDFRQKRFD